MENEIVRRLIKWALKGIVRVLFPDIDMEWTKLGAAQALPLDRHVPVSQ